MPKLHVHGPPTYAGSPADPPRTTDSAPSEPASPSHPTAPVIPMTERTAPSARPTRRRVIPDPRPSGDDAA